MKRLIFLPLLALACLSAAAPPKVEANKRLVVAFYDAVFNRHDVDAALRYLRPDYIQHNPYAATGRKAFMEFFRTYFKANPQSRAKIVHVIAEGDLVVLHVHSKATPTDRGRAVVDILRVQNGKIAEHWDAVQPVPEKSANRNTMF